MRRTPPRAVATVGLACRRLLLRLADALLPARFVVWRQTMGIAHTHVIATLAELALPDALGAGRRTATQLAAQVGADADALQRLLRCAAVLGLVRVDRRGRFSLTRRGRALRSDDPQSMRDWARYMGLDSTTSAWAGLSDSVRSGAPAFRRVHGRSVWEHFAVHPGEERLFAGAMRRLTANDAAIVVGAYPWPERGVVCDVAGGVGTLLAEVLRARPGLRGVVVDAPGVLEQAPSHLEARGVRDRVELVEGDVFARVDVTADLYLLKDVLHDWDDVACARILATVRAAMGTGARLVLVETLLERDEAHELFVLEDLQMLTQCEGGRQRSEAQLQALLRDAGLSPGTTVRTAAHALIEGVA